MWERKVLKKRARAALKKHYLQMILICFAMAYITGAYASNNTTYLVTSYDASKETETVVDTNLQENKKSNSQIVNELLRNSGVQPGKDESSKYYRGVLSGVFNNVTRSGSFLFGLLNAVNQSVFEDKIGYGVVLMMGAVITFLIWMFIKNILPVCQCRYFIESAVYDKTSPGRMLFIVRIRKWWNAAKIMFMKWLYTFLWSLTIVGGVIKAYSYMLVPYIVAENPGIGHKEAINLSRKMMKGNKWRAFVLDLSFLGWKILSLLSFGLIGIFFTNAYTTAAKAELYLAIREKAISDKIPNYEYLNDRYIGLNPAVPEGMEQIPATYPSQLFSIPEHERRNWVKVDFRRDYTIWSLILLFFTFSIIGWLWEVSLHLSTDGFVNRGTMHGPWLPIYGSGGVLVLVLLKKVREHPLVTFGLTVVICGILEYCTSWFLEMTKGMKWWDYSGYLLNLNGRICAEGLLVFGLGGCAFIYFGAPLFDELYKKIPVKIQILLCIALVSAFAVDSAYSHNHPNSGKGITDYDKFQKTSEAESLYIKNALPNSQ